MNRMNLQNVREVLAELEEDPSYKSFMDSGPDESFHQFRVGVDITGIRCLQFQPDKATPNEIEDRLGELRNSCVGTLAQFKPFIERAQAALHGA